MKMTLADPPKKKVIIITFWGEGGVSKGHLSLFFWSKNDF